MAESADQRHTLKSWQERANTLGYINGGTDGQTFALRQVLRQMPCSKGSVLHWKTLEGEDVSSPCEKLCTSQLSSANFVERVSTDEWAPTEELREWLQNDNSIFLARHIHANVKFFGEMLAAIGKETSQADLREIACETYGMNWKTIDQVHRRSAWLTTLGLLEVWGQKVVRTEAGEEFISQIQLCSPEEATGVNVADDSMLELSEESREFISGFSELDQQTL